MNKKEVLTKSSIVEINEQLEQYWKRTIKVGDFESFGDFVLYFEHHYKPMLERMQQESSDHLFRLFVDDMLSMFEN